MRPKDNQHFTTLGQQEIDKLSDISIDDASSTAANAGKVVIGKNHVGGPFGYVGAGDAHGYTNQPASAGASLTISGYTNFALFCSA